MKKYLVLGALAISSFAFSQYYPNNNYPNDGYGNHGSANDGYYSSEEDNYYFPDDYYYDYPTDYYGDNYYQSYYNDYRNSIIGINWNNFFAEFNLNNFQIRQIVYLNRRFVDFYAWNSFYRHNPDRWYYDRFTALERILGPRVYVVFQNRYYRGYDPVAYFQNYRRDYYQRKFYVTPQYRNVDVNRYRVDRTENNRTKNVGGFRDDHTYRNNAPSPQSPRNNGGFRNDSGTQPSRNNNDISGSTRNEGGFRSGTQAPIRSEDSGGRTRINENNGQRTDPTPQNIDPKENSRNDGFRQRFTTS